MNVVGAMVVALGDRMRDATEVAAAMPGALPAALVSLHEWAGGRTVDTLAGALRLSHSRTVRVVDRLAAAGLATRERDPVDGRGVLVRLTPAGVAAAERVQAARGAALAAALAGLDPAQRGALAELASSVLAELDRRAPDGGHELPALRGPRVRPPRGPLPGHAGGRCRRGRRAEREPPPSVGRRQHPFAVVLPHERLEIMSEEAGGRGVVLRAERGYGRVRRDALCGRVEMAHGVHATRCSGVFVAVPAGIQVCRCGQAPSALRSASSRSGWAKRKPSSSGRAGTARWP